MSLASKLHSIFLYLYNLDLKIRAKVPGPVLEIVAGLLLSLASGSFVRATVISAGYETLVDQHNDTSLSGLVDFLTRQVGIVIAFFVL